MQHIDGAEISVGIDLDQGARIASLQWRDLQFVVPFPWHTTFLGLVCNGTLGGTRSRWFDERCI
jgi:hypothetical protein